MENKFEIVFNEREDAVELKNLPIGKWYRPITHHLDDNMHGIIEEEEMEDEGSDEEATNDEVEKWMSDPLLPLIPSHARKWTLRCINIYS